MKLLLTGSFQYTSKELNQLQNLGFTVDFISDETEKLSINPADYDAIVCNSLFLYNDINEFKSLKFIHLTSAGTERISMDYVNQNNIELHNARGVYSVPMAEWAVGKILEIYKSSRFFYENQNLSQWTKNRNLLELSEKNALIIGLGSVGLEVAKRLSAFDTNVFGVDIRRVNSSFIARFAFLNDLDTLLPEIDILILTLPLTDSTFHLLDKKRLRLMKDNSLIINVARGSIIDEQALIATLQNGKFLGVALDVFEKEPLPKSSPLWKMKNVILSPHNSFVSEKNHERLFQLIYSNLNSFIAKWNCHKN